MLRLEKSNAASHGLFGVGVDGDCGTEKNNIDNQRKIKSLP